MEENLAGTPRQRSKWKSLLFTTALVSLHPPDHVHQCNALFVVFGPHCVLCVPASRPPQAGPKGAGTQECRKRLCPFLRCPSHLSSRAQKNSVTVKKRGQSGGITYHKIVDDFSGMVVEGCWEFLTVMEAPCWWRLLRVNLLCAAINECGNPLQSSTTIYSYNLGSPSKTCLVAGIQVSTLICFTLPRPFALGGPLG